MSAGSGHHHLIVDGKPVPKGEVADGRHAHPLWQGLTETELKLAPQAHALTMQFADGAHRSYGPDLSSTISVTVK